MSKTRLTTSWARRPLACALSVALALGATPVTALAEEETQVQIESTSNETIVVPNDEDGSTKVINGDVDYEYNNGQSEGVAVVVEPRDNGGASLTVNGDVNATTGEQFEYPIASGAYVINHGTGDVDATVAGNVSADGHQGLVADTAGRGNTTITVGDPDDPNDESGNVKTTNQNGTGLLVYIDTYYGDPLEDAKTDIVITGTVSGGRRGVGVSSYGNNAGEVLGNVNLTVWKVETGEDGKLFAGTDNQLLETFKSNVNYIVKVDPKSQAQLSGTNALIKLLNATSVQNLPTISQAGGPLQFTISVPAGMRVTNVYGYYPRSAVQSEEAGSTVNAATLTPDGNGKYVLEVVEGGGINLYVELEKIPEEEKKEETKPEEKKEEAKPEEKQEEAEPEGKVELPSTGKAPALPATGDAASFSSVAMLALSGAGLVLAGRRRRS